MVQYVCRTVDNRHIPDSEKMSHLKTLLTGKAKAAVSGMGYSGVVVVVVVNQGQLLS